MTVVAADGQYVRPVIVNQFQIAVAETYDVVVEPKDERAYTIFAESMDKSGYARGTLAPKEGMQAPIPKRGKPPVLTMADMGGGMKGMDRSKMPGMGKDPMQKMAPGEMKGMDRAKIPGMGKDPMQKMAPGEMKGMDRSQMPGMTSMEQAKKDEIRTGPRTLQYRDLKSLVPYPRKKPEREILLRLTGNMERYFWSINGKKYSEAEPIRLRYNERVRVKFVNETMMNHPMHLHGHWMELDNGAGEFKPRKHVINVKPGEVVYFDLTADALGKWAFHCHLLYHMDTGMFLVVIVEPGPAASIGVPENG